MEVQPQLILLQKTLLNIEGLGRQLYPQLDLWKTAKPILEQWMHEKKTSWQAAITTLQQEIPLWAETLPALPRILYELSQQAQQGQLKMQLSSHDLQQLKEEIHQASYRSIRMIAGASLIIGAAIIKGHDDYASIMLTSGPLISFGDGNKRCYSPLLHFKKMISIPKITLISSKGLDTL